MSVTGTLLMVRGLFFNSMHLLFPMKPYTSKLMDFLSIIQFKQQSELSRDLFSPQSSVKSKVETPNFTLKAFDVLHWILTETW